MFYKTVLPSEILSSYIDKYTMFCNIDDKGSILLDKFIPSIGEAMIFHFRDRSKAIINEKSTLLPKVIFVGQQTKYIFIDPGKVFDTLIIKFKPLIFFRLFNTSFNEINDRYLDASLLLGHEITLLHEQLGEIAGMEKRITLLEDFIIRHLRKSNKGPRYVDELQFSVNTIINNFGQLKLSELCQLSCIDERTFRRHFNLQAGVSAKSFSRIVKFGYIIQEMMKYPASKEMDLAYKYNFFDQTHFINDFKNIMGETPQSFLKRDTSNGKLISGMKE